MKKRVAGKEKCQSKKVYNREKCIGVPNVTTPPQKGIKGTKQMGFFNTHQRGDISTEGESGRNGHFSEKPSVAKKQLSKGNSAERGWMQTILHGSG